MRLKDMLYALWNKVTVTDFGVVSGSKKDITLAANSYIQVDIDLSSQLAGYDRYIINYTNASNAYIVSTNAWLDASKVLRIAYYNPTSAQRQFNAQYNVMRWNETS